MVRNDGAATQGVSSRGVKLYGIRGVMSGCTLIIPNRSRGKGHSQNGRVLEIRLVQLGIKGTTDKKTGNTLLSALIGGLLVILGVIFGGKGRRA